MYPLQIGHNSFCNMMVLGFIDHPPQDIAPGEKYIVIAGEERNYIYYCTSLAKGQQKLQPQDGMVLFVYRENGFFLFKDQQWNRINVGEVSGKNSEQELENKEFQLEYDRFIGIREEYNLIPKQKLAYLYLDGNCKINLTNIIPEAVIILKQNYQVTYQVTWGSNILWPGKTPHQITQVANSIDVLRFFRLAETEYLLASVLNEGYHF